MTDRTVRVRLEAITSMYTAKLAQAAAATKTFGATVTNATGQSRQGFDTLGLGLVGFGAAVVGGLGLATKASMAFESSFAGVRKTVSGSPAQLDQLAKGFRELATEIPVNVNELNRIGESAGQLGIKRKAILGFTETIAKLGVTTTLASDEAANALARISNIMGTSSRDYDRLGSTIVALGNAGASTEPEIVEFGLRIAGAGKLAGLTEADILGLSNAFLSVGIPAEAGGTAVQKALLGITSAVTMGGAKLELFASTAGMTATEFATAWRTDPADTFLSFIEGLGRQGQQGIATLQELFGVNERVARTFLSAAASGDNMRASVELGNQAWRENIALNEEAAKRFETTESQVQLAKNEINDLAISVGDIVKPVFEAAITVVGDFAGMLNDLPGPLKAVAAGLTGIGGVASLAAGGFLLLAPRIAATKAALVELGVVSMTAEGRLALLGGRFTWLTGLLGKAGLIAGIALLSREIDNLHHDQRETAGEDSWWEKLLGNADDLIDTSDLISGHMDKATESSGGFRDAVQKAGEAGMLFSEGADDVTGALSRQAAAYTTTADAARDKRLAELGLAGGLVGLMANIQSVGQAEQELNEARREFIRLTNNGKRGTDEWREAQQRYRDAQVGALQANISATDSIIKYGKELADAGVPQRRVIGLVREFGERAGLTKGEIRNLIDEVREHIRTLGRIPKTKHTKVTADTRPASTAINRYLAALSDKEVTVMVNAQLRHHQTAHSGGWIAGSGDVPVTAQAGEFVVNRRTARENAAMLEALNAGRVYHDGGWVGRPQVDLNMVKLAATIEEAKKSFLGGNLVQVAHQLIGMGFRISGHPAFPPIGLHTQDSYHYLGRAWDANYGPGGESAIEKAAIARVVPMLAALPHVELLHPANDPKHRDHLHYAMQGGALFGRPTSGFFTAGEREPEIVSPVSMMRQIVREEVRRLSMGIPGITGGFKDLDRLEGRLRRIIENLSSTIEEDLEGSVRRAKKAAIKELTSMLNEVTRKVERAQRHFDRLKEQATELRSSVVQSIGGFADLSSFEGTTEKDLHIFLKQQQNQAGQLARRIQELARLGLNQGALGQILSMGAEGIPLAQMLAGDPALIRMLNQTFASIGRSAKETGAFVQGEYFGKELRQAGREVGRLTKQFDRLTRSIEDFRRQIDKAVERQERQDRREERQERREERREERAEDRPAGQGGGGKGNGKGKGTKLASGAYFTQPFAGFVSMAETRPEIVSPVPVMRQIVREESRPLGPMRLTGSMRIVDFERGLVEIVDGRIEEGVEPAIHKIVHRLPS